MIFYFSIVRFHFTFLSIEINYSFSVSYIVLACYVYYYRINAAQDPACLAGICASQSKEQGD